MKQQAFEQHFADTWQRYDALCKQLQAKDKELDAEQRYELPALYRRICQHYAIAKQRHYSPHLVSALHQRVLSGHQQLYHHQGNLMWRMLEFLWITFPCQLRRHWRHFWLASALFYLPAIGVGLACYLDNEVIYSIMPDHQIYSMEYMYDPANRNLGRDEDQQSDSRVMMLGYYIMNNVSIDFRTFAMGLLAGLGTIFILIYNGVVIGGVAGHLTQLGFNDTFWPFVCGHGSFELTAIAVSGAAGLRLAQPMFAPGRYSRLEALKLGGRDAVQLVLGAGFMTFVAAFIEAFWSPSSAPIAAKYTVAAVLWSLVFLYLWRAGRRFEPQFLSRLKQ